MGLFKPLMHWLAGQWRRVCGGGGQDPSAGEQGPGRSTDSSSGPAEAPASAPGGVPSCGATRHGHEAGRGLPDAPPDPCSETEPRPCPGRVRGTAAPSPPLPPPHAQPREKVEAAPVDPAERRQSRARRGADPAHSAVSEAPPRPLEAAPCTAPAPVGAPPPLPPPPEDSRPPPTPSRSPLPRRTRLHSLLLRLQRHLVSPQSRHVSGSERLLGGGMMGSSTSRPPAPLGHAQEPCDLSSGHLRRAPPARLSCTSGRGGVEDFRGTRRYGRSVAAAACGI